MSEKSIYRRALVTALLTFLAIRLLTTGVVLIAGMFITPKTPPAPFEPSVVADLQSRGELSRLLLAPWYRWDTVHYLQIADRGYPYNLQNTVWPPLYPVLIRVFGLVFQPSLLASLVVSSLAAVVALFLLYLLVADVWDENRARHLVIWTAIFPTGFYLLAGYSESLFLALALGSLLAARKRAWWIAGLSGALATMTRLNGALLAAPILWEGWQAFRGWQGRGRWTRSFNILAATALIPLSLGVFAAWVHFGLGADWPWQTLAVDWHLKAAAPWAGIIGNLTIMSGESVDFNSASQAFDVILALWAIFLLFYGLRRMPVQYSLYSVLMLLPSLTKILDNNTLMSMSRYVLPIFPLFVTWDRLIQPRAARIFLAVVSLAGQVLLVYMFYRWFWVA